MCTYVPVHYVLLHTYGNLCSSLLAVSKSLTTLPLYNNCSPSLLFASPSPLLLLPSMTVSLQATLHLGGHGERLAQGKEVKIVTSRSLPIQIDGGMRPSTACEPTCAHVYAVQMCTSSRWTYVHMHAQTTAHTHERTYVHTHINVCMPTVHVNTRLHLY